MQFVITVETADHEMSYDEFKEHMESELQELIGEYGEDLYIKNISLSDY